MRDPDQPIRISLFAPEGRMGKAIAAAATDDHDFAIDQEHGDVLVDFSSPDGLRASLERAVSANIPILVGTTGLKPEHHQAIEDASKRVAVLRAPNTSVGVNLLRSLVAHAAERLGPEWDVEILEMHHRNKVDAPSGTALLLGQAAAQGRGKRLPDLARFDRFGESQAREPGSIGFASLRG
jgi:4-hydroxy-tetrahydrodipicolinate reductase